MLCLFKSVVACSIRFFSFSLCPFHTLVHIERFDVDCAKGYSGNFKSFLGYYKYFRVSYFCSSIFILS